MATGNVLLPVQAAKISGSFITTGATISGGDGPWKLLYDASATWNAIWQFRLPDNYASSPLLAFQFSMASATGGTIDLECDVMAVTPGDAADVDTGSFDTINEIAGGVTCPATAGHVTGGTITLTNFDSAAAGDLIFIRLHRDHDDADDTAVGNLELLGLSLVYTTT